MKIRFERRQRAQRAAAVVGIDAGKLTHALVVRPRGEADSRPFTFAASRDGFLAALQMIRTAAPDAAPENVLIGIEFAGNYGFTLAHFLAAEGYGVVSVLPAHTKRWKEVMHNQPLKTDPKDAATITDLVSQGHFVGFPFLEPVYADLRYLVSTRETRQAAHGHDRAPPWHPPGRLARVRAALQGLLEEDPARTPLGLSGP